MQTLRKKLQLAPSMMCADFLHLEEEVRLLEEARIPWLHIDVMDGHYVPNFTLGIDYCRALAGATSIPLDVHLMIEHPELHADAFCVLPGTRVTFHPETVNQPVRLIQRIKEQGATCGIAVDPSLPIEHFRYLLPLVDQILIMTVNPGYAGQQLIPHCLEKISEAREYVETEGLDIDIEVDGNVSWPNIPTMVEAGANILVVGTSSLFEKHRPRKESLTELTTLIESLS